jgi:Tellurite resistance protein TerB
MSFAELVAAPVENIEHADMVLELAFLVTAVDGFLADEEQAAFREIVGLVRGKPATEADVAAVLERFVLDVHVMGVEERVRHIGPQLPPELRELAFALSVGLGLVDHDASPHEDAHLTELVNVLDLAPERAEALASAARSAFGGGVA